jgi:hypothetical protein
MEYIFKLILKHTIDIFLLKYNNTLLVTSKSQKKIKI